MDKSKNKKGIMKTYDDCSFCGGRVSERNVKKACWWGDNLMAVVDNIPAGVCEQCGERYYKAYILKDIETLLKNNKFESTVSIPFADFSEA